MRSGARAHIDNFHTRVSSFIGQHFGKKIGLLPTAGAENHAFGGFTPHPPMPQSLRKRDLREKPRNLLESDEQCPGAPLSHLRKIPSATSGSNKGVKIVRKAISGAIARHLGDGKFYAMPHNEALVGG